MSDQVINLILGTPNDDEDDWTVYSPQLEGFSGGRASMYELQHDLPDMLRFAGVAPHTPVQVHTERLQQTPDGEYVIRIANDDLSESRIRTAERLQAALTVPKQRRDLLDAPRTRTGEVLFVCAEPSDRIRDLAAQLHPGGDAAVIVVPVADGLIWSTHITNSTDLMTAARPLGELGWAADMTVSEVMRASSGRADRPRQVLLPTAS